MDPHPEGITTATEPGAPEPFILFELAGATYGLRSRDIQQLEMIAAITPVPNAPEFVDGVVSVRGQVIPVVNLRARFGFPRAPIGLRTRLVVVRSGGRTVGLLVDAAREFASIRADEILPPPEGIGEVSGRYLEGMVHQGERLVLVLDVTDLIDPEAEPIDSTANNANHDGAGEPDA
jgi:purine-binding chemotaxis protein CheW